MYKTIEGRGWHSQNSNQPSDNKQWCPSTLSHLLPQTDNFWLQGSIFSAIGRGINAIISAIANVIMTIVGVITTVSILARGVSNI
jgi:hypothetical protein